MPHDKNGAALTAGDRVMIPCTVKEVQADGQWCNLTLTTDEPMPGNVSAGYDGKTSIVLNAKQVVKCGLVLLALLLFAPPAAAQQVPPLPQAPPVLEEIKRDVADIKADVRQIKERLGIPSPVASRPVAAAPQRIVVDVPPVAAAAPASFSGIVPPGMHAHRRVDGSVFVHADHHFGDPHAHAGVAPPWVQIATAGQYVPPSGPSWPEQHTFAAPAVTAAAPFQFRQTTAMSSGCPGGVCPVQPAGGLFRRGLFR